MMTEKEKDLQICKELEASASAVFNEFSEGVPAGIYTVADMIKVKKGSTAIAPADVVRYNIGEAREKAIKAGKIFDDMRAVNVDTFACRFPASMVFDILAKFETLARVSSAKRAKFVKEDNAGELFRVSVVASKSCACVSNYVCKYDLRVTLKYVFLEISAGQSWAVASDSKKLCAVPASAGLVSGSLPFVSGDRPGLFIPAKVWRSICGRGAVELVACAHNTDKSENDYNLTAFDASGAVLCSDRVELFNNSCFPNWLPVAGNVGDAVLFDVQALKKSLLAAAPSMSQSSEKVVLSFAGSAAISVSCHDTDINKHFETCAQLAAGSSAAGSVAFRLPLLLDMIKSGFDGRAFFSGSYRRALFGLSCGGFVLLMPMILEDSEGEALNIFGGSAPALDVVPVISEAKKAKKAKKDKNVASVEAVAVPAYPCTSGERCDAYEGAPVRELLPVYDSAEGCAVSPDLLPVLASSAPVVDLSPVVEEYAKTLQAVEVLKCSISRGWVSSDLLAAAGLSSAASAQDVAPVVVSSRPAFDRFRMWWRSLAAAVVALLAWCGLSLSSGAPSEVAPVDADGVAAVVILPAVDCVAVVPGVALPDVVFTGSAVPLELPAVDCVASAPRISAAAVTAQDLAACCSSGGLSSPLVASVVVPSVVPGVGSPAVFASLWSYNINICRYEK